MVLQNAPTSLALPPPLPAIEWSLMFSILLLKYSHSNVAPPKSISPFNISNTWFESSRLACRSGFWCSLNMIGMAVRHRWRRRGVEVCLKFLHCQYWIFAMCNSWQGNARSTWNKNGKTGHQCYAGWNYFISCQIVPKWGSSHSWAQN